MEPITWGWLAATVLSGIVGNRADAEFVRAYSTGWQRATRRLSAPELSAANNELATAVNRAFLWAQQSLVQECLHEFTGGTYQRGFSDYAVLPGHDAEVTWLIGKAKQLQTDLKQLEQGNLKPFPKTDLSALEGLLQSQDTQTLLREQLVAVVQQEQPPTSYVERAVVSSTGLLPRLAAYFELELKAKQEVQNWFQSELLMQINAQLQVIAANPLVLADFESALHNLAQQVPEVLNQIHNLKLAVNDLGQSVDEVGELIATKSDILIALSSQYGDDLAELKRSVGDIAITLQQSTPSIVPLSPIDAQPREGPNPFIYGPAVPPKQFYGRRQAIADIKNRIGAVEPQSINVVGLRRNGKSSMLRYVEKRIHEFCLFEQKPLVVLLDLQDLRFHTPLGIVEGLRRGIRKQTGTEPWAKEDNNDDFELQDGLEALRDQGYRLIVLFDEFGAIGKRLEQFQDWGDDWRAKASASLVTLVIASHRPLGEVYQTLNLTSPFGNLFSTTILGALETELWLQLLEQGQLSDAEIDWVGTIAGKLPYYTQLAAAMVWQYSDLDQAQLAFEQQAQPRLVELWHELTAAEQMALKQAMSPALPMPFTAVIENLKLYGLLKADNHMFGEGLATFVGEQS
ncbi:MAG: hypothetical protein KME14_01650 [Tildeniella torsiva UHER 1998/13D]|jgi:hypothetical protein|nr:hypothetical protein [Tildeniella torsiva UHER 1998/13D]